MKLERCRRRHFARRRAMVSMASCLAGSSVAFRTSPRTRNFRPVVSSEFLASSFPISRPSCRRSSSARSLLLMTHVLTAAMSSMTLSVEENAEDKIQEKIFAHQQKGARLPHLEEARTLVNQTTCGILSTISKKYDGFPFGSPVTFAGDDDGSILLSVSSFSPHTKDLESNPKCSLLVARDPTDRSDTFVTVIGEALSVPELEESAARTKFLERNPDAVWVDFGDFRFLRIVPKKVRYVSMIVTALASVADFTGEEFQAASVDPISKFASPIAGHMNKDHSDQTAQIVENSLGVKVESAVIQDLDRFGFSVLAKRQGKILKLRIPFPRPAEDRKAVKTLIIEMLTGDTSQKS